MSARFEIVRTDAEQPWHARQVVNDRIIWRTENLTRQVGAERSILSLARTFGYDMPQLIWNVPSVEKILNSYAYPDRPWISVIYVDERTAATR